jgi:hypothetical protein
MLKSKKGAEPHHFNVAITEAATPCDTGSGSDGSGSEIDTSML